jgi:hypothetical protein
MHLIGTHISGSIERPAARGSDPQKECLANGNWNFDWQRTYIYDAALDQLPSVQAGDTIDIQLGEGGSTDEMCLEIFGIAVDAPPQPTGRTAPDTSMIPSALFSAIR